MNWDKYNILFPDNYVPTRPDIKPSSLPASKLEKIISKINLKARDMDIKSEVYTWDKDNNMNIEVLYDIHSYPSPDGIPALSVFGARALYEFQERQRRQDEKYKSYYFALDTEKIIDDMWDRNEPFDNIRELIYNSMVTLFFNYIYITMTNPEYEDLSLYSCYYFYTRCFNQGYEHNGEQLVKIYNEHLRNVINSDIFINNNTFISFDFLAFLNDLEIL